MRFYLETHFYMSFQFAPKVLRIALSLLLSAVFTLMAFARPEIVQTIEGFDRPVAALYSPDGKSLFVANRPRGKVGVHRGKGHVTKLQVSDDGTVTVASRQFIGRLTAPSDMAFGKRIYTNDVKARSLFVLMGTPLIENEMGRIIKDATNEFIGIKIYDPNNGRLLAEMDMGPDSKLYESGNMPLISPSCIEFDDSGNLYIGDTGIGGHVFKTRTRPQPIIYRITPRGISDLITGVEPKDVQANKLSSIPIDMVYKPAEKALFFLANHTQGAPSGAVFKIPADQFQGLSTMTTIVRKQPALKGIRISPRRIYVASANGDLMFPKGRDKTNTIRFRPQTNFSSPGRFDVLVQDDGSLLLAIPEETGKVSVNQGNSLRMVKLPKGY